jgi:hypothetical protein
MNFVAMDHVDHDVDVMMMILVDDVVLLHFVDDVVVLLHLLMMLLFCWSCWELDARRARRRRRGGRGRGGVWNRKALVEKQTINQTNKQTNKASWWASHHVVSSSQNQTTSLMIKNSLIVYWVLPPSLRNSRQTIQGKTHMRGRSMRERERERERERFLRWILFWKRPEMEELLFPQRFIDGLLACKTKDS